LTVNVSVAAADGRIAPAVGSTASHAGDAVAVNVKGAWPAVITNELVTVPGEVTARVVGAMAGAAADCVTVREMFTVTGVATPATVTVMEDV
jgi:hypothetical protein